MGDRGGVLPGHSRRGSRARVRDDGRARRRRRDPDGRGGSGPAGAGDHLGGHGDALRGARPAISTLGVAALVDRRLLVEIEVEAIVGAGDVYEG
jgi:hypothetical protein